MRDLDRLAIEFLRLAALKKRRLIDRDLVSLALSLDSAAPAARSLRAPIGDGHHDAASRLPHS